MTEDTGFTPEQDDVAERLSAALGVPPEPLPAGTLPPPVTDYGLVRLELMGHRYREGHLSETVIAGTPFLRLDLAGGAVEYYRPDAVYCIAPAMAPVPRAAIPASLGYALGDDPDDDDTWSSRDD